MFVENVSLFSQFYVINWCTRFNNVLNDTDHQGNYNRNEENIQDLKELLNFVENQPKLGDPC